VSCVSRRGRGCSSPDEINPNDNKILYEVDSSDIPDNYYNQFYRVSCELVQ
jgi:hypothetical protein